MQPNISVIIPVYNRERSISMALESLIKQSFIDFEVIIINDGSTDETASVVQNYCDKDSRMRIYSQENLGVSNARNYGISLASGKYIAFLDSDDFYEQDFLLEMTNRIFNDNSDLCYCGYYSYKDYEKKKKEKIVFHKANVLQLYLLGKLKTHISCWVISKKLLIENSLSFNSSLSWGEDVEFISKCIIKANSISYVKRHLTNYVVEEDVSKLSKFSINKIDSDYLSLMNIIDFSKQNEGKDVPEITKYRLPALITYRLNLAINKKISMDLVRGYYEKYEVHLSGFKFNNGLRSFKLLLSIMKLKLKIKGFY
ncbi:glycosyltransferase family 2 protein [Paenibacillus tepidiphilus]|uniref:glycosyltransferase family 2 protein n=1 Tax=Paenibacillus tepidiphilus TaxID=2608683 RepID=UPI00123851A9|nr:glycosyltransferase family A protein [Paenibacillus tepidiphilus]